MAINVTGGTSYASLFNLSESKAGSRQDMLAKVKVKRSAASMVKQAETAAAKGGTAAASQFASRRQLDKYQGDAEINFARILDDDAIPKVNQLLRILSDGKLFDKNLFLQFARALFPDDSDLVMVLRELLRRRRFSTAVSEELAELLEEVEAQADPKYLNAGINCALKARLFGQTHLELRPSLLRGSYRLFLEQERRALEDYQDWVTSYGHQFRSQVLAFIESALIADVYAATPSSKTVYGDIIGKLGQLRLIRSSDSLFMTQLLSNKVINGLNKSEPDWLIFFLSLLVSPENLDAHLNYMIGDEFLLFGHNKRSTILQPIFRTCKSLPLELFYSAELAQDMFMRFEYLAGLAYKREVIESRMNR